MRYTWKTWLKCVNYGGFILIGLVVGLGLKHQSNKSLINTDELNAVLMTNIVRSGNDLQVAKKSINELNTAMQQQNDAIFATKELLTQLIDSGKLDESVVRALNAKAGWQLTAKSLEAK